MAGGRQGLCGRGRRSGWGDRNCSTRKRGEHVRSSLLQSRGDGRLTWRYAREVSHIVGIEIEQDDLRLATVDRPSDLENKVVFANADSIYLPFSKETFDIAILSWSL